MNMKTTSSPSIYGFRGNRITHLREVLPTTRHHLEMCVKLGIIEHRSRVFSSYISVLKPGGFIVPHIDAGSEFYERWQIPIQVAGKMWVDGETFVVDGPYQLEHWKPHAVWNTSDKDRIHIVLQTPKVVFVPESPVLMEIVKADIPELAELINQHEK